MSPFERFGVFAALSCLALAEAYSVTPFFGAQLAGSSTDNVTDVVVDPTGFWFATGVSSSEVFNASYVGGGPLGSSSNPRAAVLTGSQTAFVSKYGPAGHLWTAVITGGSTVGRAIALGHGRVFVCGTNTAAATVQGPTGPAISVNYYAGSFKQSFVAAFDAVNGTALWAKLGVSSEGNADALCYDLQYTPVGLNGGTVGVVGSLGEGVPANWGGTITVGDELQSALIGTGASTGKSYGWFAAFDADTGSNPRIGPAARTPTGEFPQLWSFVARALAFDANGHAYVLSAVTSDGSVGPAGTRAVHMMVYTNTSVAYFNSQNGFLYPEGWNGLLPSMTPGYDQLQLWSGFVNSPADDVPVAIDVLVTGTNNGDVGAALAATRLAVAGYTVGGQGVAFNFSSSISGSLAATLPSNSAPWFTVNTGSLSGVGGGAAGLSATAYGGATLSGTFGGMACDKALTGHCWLAGTWTGSASVTTRDGAKTFAAADADAALLRVTGSGSIEWFEVVSSVGVDAGVAAGVLVMPTANPAVYRQSGFLGGAFAGNLSVTPASAAPLTLVQKGGGDGFVVSFDDLDDCGLQAGYPQPFGANACGVTADLNALGASLCVDQPGLPGCFCNMNVTNSLPLGSGFCNARGWDCSFMAPYYYGLLNQCACPQLPQPSANPLLDVAGRLALCGPGVCNFGSLTGANAQCLPLVLDLLRTCASPTAPTPAADRVNIGAFQELYAQCPKPVSSSSSSSTGPIAFDAAPVQAIVSAAVTGAAVFAGVALTAGAAAAAGDL